MPKVKDYMSHPVITVTQDHSVVDAVKIMNENDTDGLVVVDKDVQKLVGVISFYDILKYLVPDYLEMDKNLASFEPSELFLRRAMEIKNHTVRECMTSRPSLQVVHPEDSLIEAAALLTEYRIHRLPVVDERNNLVGYISKSDIKRALGKFFTS